MSATTSISNTNAILPTNVPVRMPVQTLGQDDFLKLLVTQMTSQDPMNPQTDTNSIAQMAQFSALEQSRTTQSVMTQIQADSLIGKQVQLQSDAGTTVAGLVTGVQMDSGNPMIVVNGNMYDLSTITTVTLPQPSTP
jgi:flagellar basal-body rod modification protein FlgD